MMGYFASFIYTHPKKVIMIVLLFLAFPISYLPQIKMDTSTEGFMHDDDPVLVTYNKFRDDFGRDEMVVVGIKNDAIFSLDFLTTLKQIHEEIEKTVPYLADVTSLYNVRNTRGEKDLLLTRDLLDPFPTTKSEVQAIEKRTMASHFYKDLFISQDGKMTMIVIETDTYSHVGEEDSDTADSFLDGFEASAMSANGKAFLTDQENNALIDVVQNIAKKYRAKGLEIYVAGSPVVNNALKAHMMQDMAIFMSLIFLIVLTFLYMVFKRWSAVVYPLVVIIFSLLTTVGTMAWAGVMFKIPTQIVPSLVIAVSVGATVHIMSIFFDYFNQHKDKKEALIYTFKHSGLAIAMTSVTTAIGVGSFAGSQLAPISDLGIFASLGVMVSLLLTLILLPALLVVTRLEAKEKQKAGWIDNIMKSLAIIPVKYTKQILSLAAIGIVVTLLAATQVTPSYNPLLWFEQGEMHRVATETIDKTMHGTTSIEIVIDAKKENAWINPEKLKILDALTVSIETYKDAYVEVGKVFSLVTIVKETNRALHENNESFYTIADDDKLLAQELLLFENSGSDDLEDVVDSQFSKVRLTVKLPWIDAIKAEKIMTFIRTQVASSFPNDSVAVTGMVPLLINTFSNAVYSSIRSYAIAAIAITFMMILILGSIRLGLLSMIPNIVPILGGLFLMAVGGMALDIFTLLIGSIAIGLAVDDTIHFTHNFKRYYLKYGDSKRAIEETFLSTGKAMFITTMVLASGFFIYIASSMISIQNFGILTGSVIVFALISDLFLAPALMIVAAKRGWIK